MPQQYGLIQIKNNNEIQEEDHRQQDAANRVITEYESRLSSHIQKVWEQNRWAKEEWEDEMLECLRQRNGEYDSQTLGAIREQGGSEIYMMLTATKIRAAVSWIRDILLPAGDKPWGLNPTPIPDLPDDIVEAIGQRIHETMPPLELEEGDEAYIQNRAATMRDTIMKEMRMLAEEAAERMELKIHDQLVEGNWEDALTEFIEDFCTFPAAIMKGPLITKKRKLTWGKGGVPIVNNVINLEFKRVSPFDCYPAPYATSIDDGDFIERIRFSRREIYNLMGMPGYNDEAIRAVLQDYGRNGLRDWLWKDYERAKLEGRDKHWLRQDQHSIDGIHFFGSVQGLILLEWGMSPDKIPDPMAEYEIDAIKIGRHVIRAVINRDPLHRRGYHKASFQKIPGGFWGIAIAKLMRDHQRMCNATARSLANNLGIASGPMVEVEVDRLADGEQVEQLYPWKIFQTKADKTGRGREAVRFFQARSNAQELLAVYEQFERRADDATSIPRYAYGNERVGGAGNTASGLSMLMNNASKGIKLAISSIDVSVIQPAIEQVFTFNMMYDPDPTIKGDASIVARGATAMLTREQAQMRRAEFLAMTNNAVDMEIMGVEGRVEVLRANAELLDMNTDKIVPTLEDFKLRQQERLQREGEQQDPKLVEIQLKAQAEAEKRQADAEFAERKLQLQAEYEKEKLQAQDQMHRDKMDREYDLKMQLLDEEARQKEAERELERYRETEQRSKDIERIREQVRLEHEKTAAATIEAKPAEPAPTQPAQAVPAPVINLAIDGKDGEVKMPNIDAVEGKVEELASDQEKATAARTKKEEAIIGYLRKKHGDDPAMNKLLDTVEGAQSGD